MYKRRNNIAHREIPGFRINKEAEKMVEKYGW